FDEQCMERLRKIVPVHYMASRVLKVAMIGESEVDRRAAPIYKPHTDVQTTILAHGGEVQLHLQAQAASAEEARRKVDGVVSKLEDEFEDSVFSAQGETLEQIAGYYLQMRGASLAVAESCTGGMLAQRITSVSGSSRYFLGGAVVYSNKLKTKFAAVPADLSQTYGAVSAEGAKAIAEGSGEPCGSRL